MKESTFCKFDIPNKSYVWINMNSVSHFFFIKVDTVNILQNMVVVFLPVIFSLSLVDHFSHHIENICFSVCTTPLNVVQTSVIIVE